MRGLASYKGGSGKLALLSILEECLEYLLIWRDDMEFFHVGK